jgi:hypothetical protein
MGTFEHVSLTVFCLFLIIVTAKTQQIGKKLAEVFKLNFFFSFHYLGKKVSFDRIERIQSVTI